MSEPTSAHLESRHVYIDTNIFRRKAFDLTNPAIKKLGELAEERKIFLYTTSITEREIERNIVKLIDETFGSPKKMNVHFRNAGLPELDLNAIKQARLAAWRGFAERTEIHALDIPDNALEEVLDLYFESKPPFKNNTDKKSEFPDAFILAALKSWCEEYQDRMYVVTDDALFREACQDTRLVPLVKLEEYLDLYSKLEASLYAFAHLVYEHLQTDIEKQIARNIEDRGYDIPNLWNSDISDLEVNHIYLQEPKIINATEDICQIEVEAEISVSAYLNYEDSFNGSWDYETKEFFSARHESETISGSFMVSVSIEICCYEDRNPAMCDVVRVSIPGEIRFRVMIEKYSDRYEVVAYD